MAKVASLLAQLPGSFWRLADFEEMDARVRARQVFGKTAKGTDEPKTGAMIGIAGRDLPKRRVV